jgi:hypothetical protein
MHQCQRRVHRWIWLWCMRNSDTNEQRGAKFPAEGNRCHRLSLHHKDFYEDGEDFLRRQQIKFAQQGIAIAAISDLWGEGAPR